MNQDKPLEVNYENFGRFLYYLLRGPGCGNAPPRFDSNGNRAILLDSADLQFYCPPKGCRFPTRDELLSSLKSGALAEFGFSVFSDNFSNLLIWARPGTTAPARSDIPVDMFKFERFLSFLFSGRARFTPEDAGDLILEDQGEFYICINDLLIQKFRSERGTRKPTIPEIKAHIENEMSSRYKLKRLGDNEALYGITLND